MREYGGGFGAQTKDRRDEWERKYGDLYNHAFLELIEENTNDVMLADSKIERVKEIMQRIERERSFPPEKAAA